MTGKGLRPTEVTVESGADGVFLTFVTGTGATVRLKLEGDRHLQGTLTLAGARPRSLRLQKRT